MAETYNFEMPLLDAAQAQKHVTVNEAVARADAVAQMRLVARGVSVPPVAINGAAYAVGTGATGDWAGQGGNIAIRSNGGWVFLTPKAGWRGWDETTGEAVTYDGTDWQSDAVVVSTGGSGTSWRIAEIDHVIVAGSTSTTVNVIPNNAQVIGVTGRVISAIDGAGIASWKLGVPGADNRYGYGLGLALNSWVRGVSGQPLTYYADTPLLLSADAGTFSAGLVRLAVHYLELTVPRAV
ncbi:MAG: DUF2793 domain-containing protein [Rhodobacteraceae bacterium]|nr:DUF2793 domain-containing protein [Paracoccaceae bacterium]